MGKARVASFAITNVQPRSLAIRAREGRRLTCLGSLTGGWRVTQVARYVGDFLAGLSFRLEVPGLLRPSEVECCFRS
jgi:hypothetical protein